MNKRQTGTTYEDKAALWLESRGMKVIERNFRCRQGEIDLIAQDGRYLVFVEVKYRSDDRSGYPSEAVNFRKQKRIMDASVYYCCKYGISEDYPCRYDVVSILGDQITHIENAFEYRS
jgi:putative endonuclease